MIKINFKGFFFHNIIEKALYCFMPSALRWDSKNENRKIVFKNT